MTGAVGERRIRADHAVAIRAQLRQAPHHLAREPLDSSDLRSRSRPAVDRNLRGGSRTCASGHYAWRTVRRSTSPAPSSPTPAATMAHMFRPV
jgi:hypothetical protein